MNRSDYVMGDVDKCAACGGMFVVRKNGTMRRHLGNVMGERYGRPVRLLCAGAGKPPAPAGATAGAEQ